jgi:hypothetical protein
MTVEQFPSSAPNKRTKSQQLFPEPGASGKSVSIFQNGKFMLNFSGSKSVLAIAPGALSEKGPNDHPVAAEERKTIVSLLALEDSQAEAIDAIANEHDLTFREALNFHLAMTLPE